MIRGFDAKPHCVSRSNLITRETRFNHRNLQVLVSLFHVNSHVMLVNVSFVCALMLHLFNLVFLCSLISFLPSRLQIDEQQVADKEVMISKNCCWCQQTLTVSDRPKLLECFHSCCEQCLKQEQQKAAPPNQSCNVLTIICPLCRTDNRSDYIINNHFLIEMLNLIQNEDGASGSGTSSSGSAEEAPKCANDDNPATSYCVDCEELICDNCVAAHQVLKITKDHTIKSKDAAENKSDKDTKKEIKCQMHPQVRRTIGRSGRDGCDDSFAIFHFAFIRKS